MAGMELGGPLADAGIPLPSWVAQGGAYTYWTGATRIWAAGTMWLLAGVQHMRVLRMSHGFTLVSPPPFALAGGFLLVFVFVGFVVVVFWGVGVCFPVLQVQGGLFCLFYASSR